MEVLKEELKQYGDMEDAAQKLEEESNEKLNHAESATLKMAECLRAQRVRCAAAKERSNEAILKGKASSAANAASVKKYNRIEIQRLQSSNYKQSRDDSKTITTIAAKLNETVHAKERQATEFGSIISSHVAAAEEKVRLTANQELKAMERVHAAELKRREAQYNRDSRNASKAVTQMQGELASILSTTNESAFNMQVKINELIHRAIDADREAAKADRQTKLSIRQSTYSVAAAEINAKELTKTVNENKKLANELSELQDRLEETSIGLEEAKNALPHTVIGKELCRGCVRQWPLYIWELILEQLVNGTPPSSVADNIVAHVKQFSPTTVIKELHSIWTIRRARTVLLVIVQTLAAHRLAKADKWEQLFTDGTSRRQVSFQNLVLGIKED